MDLPSDSDESDIDFVPDNEEPVSEAESEIAEEETEDLHEDNSTKKKLKRKAKQIDKKTKKPKISNDDDSPSKKSSQKTVDPEKEKKYEDDLWASFLETPSASKSSTGNNDLQKESPVAAKENIQSSEKLSNKNKPDTDIEPKTVDDLFKTLESEGGSKCIVNKIAAVKDNVTSSPVPRLPIPATKRSGGGLASVLNKIGKKDKLSTLEKTKLDWMTFKKEEGIEEDISTHNRGRNGYLERQDFLQRTDVNQFEIEKNLRINKRSSR